MNEQKAYYAIIPANVRYDKKLSANAKLLYGEITALCNQTGVCWATNSYFLSLYGVSERSVTRWLNELKEGGYINLFNSSNSQYLSVERCISLKNGVDNFVQKGRQFCPEVDNFGGMGRQFCPKGVDKIVYYNNTENITRIDDDYKKLLEHVNKLFVDVVIDEKLYLTLTEYEQLSECYKRSTWLNVNFKLISKIHFHKDKILLGKYNDFEKVSESEKQSNQIIKNDSNSNVEAERLNNIFDLHNVSLI